MQVTVAALSVLLMPIATLATTTLRRDTRSEYNCDPYSGKAKGMCQAYLAQGCDVAFAAGETLRRSCVHQRDAFLESNDNIPFYWEPIVCPCFTLEEIEALDAVRPFSGGIGEYTFDFKLRYAVLEFGEAPNLTLLTVRTAEGEVPYCERVDDGVVTEFADLSDIRLRCPCVDVISANDPFSDLCW